MEIQRHLRRSALIADTVRAWRLRRGHPDWSHLSFPHVDGNGQRILLGTVGGGYLAGARVEALVGLALAARGAEVEVLLCDGEMPACLECNRDWYPNIRRFAKNGPTDRHCSACFEPALDFFERAGLRVHRYSDVLDPADSERFRKMAQELSPEALATYEEDGIRVGEHALSGALRFFARSELPRTAEADVIHRRYFEAALRTSAVVNRLQSARQFDAVVAHHGIYTPQGVMGDVIRAHGARIVNWHVAYRKGCFIFSHGDTYHHTLIDEPVDAWESMQWTDAHEHRIVEYLESRRTGREDWIVFHRGGLNDAAGIRQRLDLDPQKPWIGMLTNVLWDAQLHYPANAFKSQVEWGLATVDHFSGRPDLELLIRVHPGEVSGNLRSRQPFAEVLHQARPSLPPNVHVIGPESDVSTYSAMDSCDTVLIYGTKTGVELAAMGKPVVVAGEAWIRNKGISMDATSASHYLELLDRLPLGTGLDRASTLMARKYAYHFFFRRMIPIELSQPEPGIPGFSFNLPDATAFDIGADAGLDVICDGILDGRPFVYPAEAGRQ